MEYDRITSTLYMGNAPKASDVIPAFHEVVLCAEEHQPNLRNANVVRCPIPDAELTSNQIQLVAMVAAHVAKNMDSGLVTLVTCWAGLNRSGLVCALALMLCKKHYSALDAIQLVRKARGPYALSNEHFVELLTTKSH